jgi:hypothetical protein
VSVLRAGLLLTISGFKAIVIWGVAVNPNEAVEGLWRAGLGRGVCDTFVGVLGHGWLRS